MLWGGDPDGLSLATPELALPPAADPAAVTAMLAGAPAMQRAAADLDWRSAAARLERSKRYPDVSLIVGQKREGSGRERQTLVGLSVPLPLFDRNQGAIREADHRIDKARPSWPCISSACARKPARLRSA
ncbi:TolC family protein [Massilia sp. H-1]|nr:TolC family protein [Massilia sp. H-1]